MYRRPGTWRPCIDPAVNPGAATVTVTTSLGATSQPAGSSPSVAQPGASHLQTGHPMTSRNIRPLSARLVAAVVTVAVSFGMATPASARSVVWSGAYRTDDFIVQTVVLSVDSGRVTLKSLQTRVQCTDTGDGTVSPTAVWVVDHPQRATLRGNRFAFEFTQQPSGLSPMVRYRITGTLNSNGRGSVRVVMDGDSISPDTGEVIARCADTVTFQVRRGGVRI